jgi:signal transduction histidine kinase
MVEFLSNLIDVPSTDPDSARRRRLLNILLVSTAVITIVGLLAVIVYDVLGFEQEAYIFYQAIAVMLPGLLVIFLINRYRSGWVAATLFLLVFILILSFDNPVEVVRGRTLFMYVIPILIASMILPSYASLLTAALVNVVMIVIAIWAELPPNLAAVLAFFLIGLVSWLAARSLEHVLHDVRAVNRELDQRMAERQRLAGEIHDTLAQGFISIIMQLDAVEPDIPAVATPVQHRLDQARYIARDSLVEARRLMWTLQPVQLEQAPLSEAIQRVASRWSKQSEIPTTTTVTGEVERLKPEIEVTLLRATQEALANIRKHAAARKVNVTLSYMNDVVMLDIQDNGMGFAFLDQTAVLPSVDGGYGLKAMRDRVSQLGGSLEVESVHGEGTILVVQLPV